MKKTVLSIILIAFGITLNAQTYVNQNATGANNGTSWADAYTDLHTALFNTTSGEIWVAQGTYVPSKTFTGNIPADNRQKTFRVKNNVQVYGGFTGTETLLSERNWKANPTIVSGNLGGGTKVYNVVRFDANNNTTVFDGFIVQDGSATSTNATGSEQFGAGIYMNLASPTIRNCKIQNNVTLQHGGGVFINGGATPVIENCEFVNNSTTTYDAGALYINGVTSSARVVNCLFNQNVAARYAGALVIQNTLASFVTNCTFVNNQRGTGTGKSIFHSVSTGTPVMTISNCMFYGNTPGNGDEVNRNGMGQYHIKNCFSQVGAIDFTGAASITASLSGNPFFTDYTNGDFTLLCKSLAVNAGNASGLTIPATDLNGNPRTNGTIDIGAFENNISSIGIEANKTSICLGDYVVLRGTCDPAGYTWSNGVTNNVAFYPTSTQTYTCTGLTAGSTDQITIEVVSIANENVNAPTTICSGSNASVTLANSAIGAQYFLRDNSNNLIVDGPVAGTGAAINFTANNLNSTTTFNVVGATNAQIVPVPDFAVDFDGINDKIGTNYYFPTTSKLSLEAWIYPEATTYKRIITSFSGSNPYASDVVFDTYNATDNGRGLRLVIGTSNTASVANVLTLNAWNHVAATFNSGVINFYVNGASVGTFTVATTTLLTNVTRSMTIGEDYVTGPANEFFNGKIDEVRIWKRTLSQTEIAANMNNCLTGNEDSLEVYYRMNEGTSSIINDLSGNGKHGTLYTSDAINHWLSSNISCGSTLNVSNNFGHALDFDGINDMVNTSFTMPATSTFSIEGWVYPRSTNYDRLFSNYSTPLNGTIVIDTYSATNNGTALRFNVYGTSNAIYTVGAPNVLTLNAWNHVACTFNNGVMTIYVNGFEAGTGTAPFTSIPQIATNLCFGEDFVPGTAEYLNGKMDEVRVWGKALNQTEIMTNMNNCLTGTETDLLAYYNFENGIGTVVSDLTIGQKDGLMQNMDAATDWVSGQFSCETNCSLQMAQTVTVNVTTIDKTISVAFDSISATQAGASYQWLDCNNAYSVISGETAQSFTPTVNGSYAVAITLNSCTDTSACINFNSVSLKKLESGSFILFPNPASSTLTIKSKEIVEKLEIYDMLGTLVQSETKNCFSVEQLISGIYIVQIKTSRGISSMRFIKE